MHLAKVIAAEPRLVKGFAKRKTADERRARVEDGVFCAKHQLHLLIAELHLSDRQLPVGGLEMFHLSYACLPLQKRLQRLRLAHSYG